MKRLLLNVTKCFLPVLFVTYMAGITFFAHVHVVNGVTIVHSHPFKKAAEHGHTTIELLTIHFLSNWTADGDVGILSLSLFIPFLLCLLLRVLPCVRRHAPYHGVIGLRAPPVVRFS